MEQAQSGWSARRGGLVSAVQQCAPRLSSEAERRRVCEKFNLTHYNALAPLVSYLAEDALEELLRYYEHALVSELDSLPDDLRRLFDAMIPLLDEIEEADDPSPHRTGVVLVHSDSGYLPGGDSRRFGALHGGADRGGLYGGDRSG